MLTAITEGKAGRIDIPGSECSIGWREVFRRSEDLLTAVFFGRLSYLSDESLTSVMALLISQDAAVELGAFKEIEFWPHLTKLKERSWVEPDILIHFENATLIIEVKPPFGGGQNLAQWQAQVHAFVAECLEGSRTAPEVVHFVALGRNSTPLGKQSTAEFDTQDCFRLTVSAQEWNAIVKALPAWQENCTRTDRAVFQDWEKAFDLFGMHLEKPAPGWSDFVSYEQQNSITLEIIRLWNFRKEEPRQPTRISQAENMHHSWQPLFAYAQSHPVEPRSWK